MMQPWIRLTVNVMLLSLETQRVILLRMAAMAAGGAHSHAEAQRMVSEKLIAAMSVNGDDSARTFPAISRSPLSFTGSSKRAAIISPEALTSAFEVATFSKPPLEPPYRRTAPLSQPTVPDNGTCSHHFWRLGQAISSPSVDK
jgi:hypothetical protein